MKALFLIGSHLIALGLGAFWSEQQEAPGSVDEESIPKAQDRATRPRTPSYRISPGRLLDALNSTSPHYQALYPPSRSPSENSLSPAERAAGITDFAGELQSHVDVFNRTGDRDFRYTQAVIARWMSLDPAAAMRFVGTMKLRNGWGDHWPALFKNKVSLDGLALVEIARSSWFSFHREKGMPYLARYVGAHHPDQIPEILEALHEDGEAVPSQFLKNAFAAAMPADYDDWAEVVSSLDPARQEPSARQLARALIPDKVPSSWLNPQTSKRGEGEPTFAELEALVQRSRGTAMESFLQNRWEQLRDRFEAKMSPSSPSPSSAPKVAPNSSAPQEMRRYELRNRLGPHSSREIRQVLNNNQSMKSALQSLIAQIDAEFTEQNRIAGYRFIFEQGLLIDPLETIELLRGKLPREEVEEAFNFALGDPNANFSIQRRAEMVGQLIASPYRDDLPNPQENLVSIVLRYHSFHTERASEWIRTLPGPVIDQIKASDSPAEPIIANALAQ